MKRILFAIVILMAMVMPCLAKSKWTGYVSKGGKFVRVSTLTSYRLMETYPGATVTVYLTGTLTLATIYSNNAGALKANPFVSDLNAKYEFYVDDGRYDIKFSGTGIAVPFTFTDLSFFDREENLASPTNNGTVKISDDATDPLDPIALSVTSQKLIGLPLSRERINIGDYPYNAICDGTTNVGPAFDAALAAAKTNGNPKLITFPPGTCKISTPVAETFSNSYDIIIKGSGSGTVLLLATGASNAISLGALYSLTISDLAFAGNAAAGPISDAATAISITNVTKALIINNQFYALYNPTGLIVATSSDITVTDNKFRGSFACGSGPNCSAIVSNNWIGGVVKRNHFIDFGDLNAGGFISRGGVTANQAWILFNKPAAEIVGTVAPVANALAQRRIVIEDNIFDEGATFHVYIASNIGIGEPYNAFVRIAGNSSNVSSVSGGSGYYIQGGRHVEIDQNYVGYASNPGLSRGLYIDSCKEVHIKGDILEQEASNIYVRGTDYLYLDEVTYRELDTDGVSKIKIRQGGKESNKIWPAGIYTFAQLTPSASISEILRATPVLDFDLTSVVYQDLTVPVVGAVALDSVHVAPPNASMTDVEYSAWVSATDVVTVRAKRLTGTPNPASGSFSVTVSKY